MSILENTAKATNNQAAGNGNRSTARSDQPKAQIWANIGYSVKEGGPNGEDVFVSLPLGLAIDTMQTVDESVNTESFAMLRQGQNALLRQIQEASAQLGAGETRILNLQVELRRVKDKATSNINDNHLVQAIDLFA